MQFDDFISEQQCEEFYHEEEIAENSCDMCDGPTGCVDDVICRLCEEEENGAEELDDWLNLDADNVYCVDCGQEFRDCLCPDGEVQ
jgi:hypothetical protein